MPDPSPAQQIRNLCDQISDLIETIEPAAPVPTYGGTDNGGGAAAPKAPMTDNMVIARDNLKQTLTSWALLIVEEGHHNYTGRDETTAIAAWIYGYADWMTHHPAFDDFITEVENEMRAIHDELNRHIDDRRFCGWHNGHPVYARHDQASVIIDGTTYTPQEGQDRLKAGIADVDLTAKECALVLTQVHGIKTTAKQILKLLEVDNGNRATGALGQYEGLHPVGRKGPGPKSPLLFRFEEVLTRTQQSGCRSGQKAG